MNEKQRRVQINKLMRDLIDKVRLDEGMASFTRSFLAAYAIAVLSNQNKVSVGFPDSTKRSINVRDAAVIGRLLMRGGIENMTSPQALWDYINKSIPNADARFSALKVTLLGLDSEGAKFV